jgi:hypothetical protein
MPSDLAAEAKRKPVVKGETWAEVSGRLVNQVHSKNAALRRSIQLYNDCRA